MNGETTVSPLSKTRENRFSKFLPRSPLFQPSINPSVVSTASFAWSKGQDANSPLRIQFPYEWNTQCGPIFDWYRMQPTTRFRALQYRKERQKPFCHEFIIVKLVDGPICRFERLGDPNDPAKAMTRTGSAAYDMAQYFREPKWDALDEESDVVFEIEFSRGFDLLDVLSICYAIHEHHEAKHYTLQRYNCYFLSWTIMSCLARSSSAWDQIFTESIWETAMDTSFGTLREFSLSHQPSHPHELAFRVTRLLAADEASPTDFILGALKHELMNDATRRKVCTALREFLWKSATPGAIRMALIHSLTSAAKATAGHASVGRSILETPCSAQVLGEAKAVMDMQELKLVERQWSSRYNRTWRQQAKVALEEHYAEHRVGFLGQASRTAKMMECSLAGMITGATSGLKGCITEGRDVYKRLRADWGRQHASRTQGVKCSVFLTWAMVTFVARVVATYAKTTAITAQVKYMNQFSSSEFPLPPDWIDMTDAGISGALDAGRRDPEFVRACVLRTLAGSVDFTKARSITDDLIATMCRKWEKTWETWVVDSISEVLTESMVEDLFKKEPKAFSLTSPVNDSGEAEIKTLSASDFHEFIQSLIVTHSARVAKHQLGSETLISRDIQNAMAGVWKTASLIRNSL